jgi:hypothetical protein
LSYYNDERKHTALNQQPPMQRLAQLCEQRV